MRTIKWLFVFAICLSGRNAFCDPSLNMKDTLNGVRGDSVHIPCTYKPSEDYKEVKVEWFLQSEVIIQRIASQDHVSLVKFRERVEISKSPGDVSLTIKKLGFGDRGNVRCKVTWEKNDGTPFSKEEITDLKILRVKPTTEKPKGNIFTTTHQEHEIVKPTTEKPKEIIFTTTHQEHETMKPTTEKPKENIFTTTHQEHETTKPITEKDHATILPKVTTGISHSDDVLHVSTFGITKSTKLTSIAKFHESTTLIPWYTTEIFYNTPATAQNKGFGMPLYILIAIIICVLCIITVIIVLMKKKRKVNIYELPTMNQLLALESAGNGCQSRTDGTRASNTYEPCNPAPISDYEGIVLPFSNEYDLLVVENKPEENCS